MKQVWLACILGWSFVMELQTHFLFKDFVSSYTLQGLNLCVKEKEKSLLCTKLEQYYCTHKKRKVPEGVARVCC